MAPEAAADASTKSMMPFRAVEYRLASGADAPEKSAKAYVVKPGADDLASKVSKALQVDKADVSVGVGGYEWYYSGPNGGAVDLSSPATGVAIACSPEGACPEPTPTPTVPGVPSPSDAEERTRTMLDDLGVSIEGRFEVFGEDGYSRTVVFSPTVDGVRALGLETSITYGEDGRVTYANGVMAKVEPVGTYSLVGLDVALKRLQDGFGSGGARMTGAPTAGVTAEEPVGSGSSAGEVNSSCATSSGGGSAGSGSVASGSTSSSSAEACDGVATPTATCTQSQPCSVPPSPPDEPTMTIEPQPTDPTVPFEPQVVEITGADLVLQIVASGCPGSGDPVYLVPTFELQPGPAGLVTAVVDDALDTVSTGDAKSANPCPDRPPTDVPLGKPEPAPMPAETGRDGGTPAKP